MLLCMDMVLEPSFSDHLSICSYIGLLLNKVQTVEEQVRAAAEHKLGVANQSITAGFFDNNTR